MMSRSCLFHRSSVLMIFVLLRGGLLACSGDPAGSEGAEDSDLESSQRAPLVESFEPQSSERGRTVSLRVLGKGFDDGSRVDLELDGQTIDQVMTRGTRFVTTEELVADIAIAVEAPIGLYQVQVTTSKGKRGIGLEDFAVLVDTPEPEPPLQEPEVVSQLVLPDSLTVMTRDTTWLVLRDRNGAVIAGPGVVFTCEYESFCSTNEDGSTDFLSPLRHWVATIDATGLVWGGPATGTAVIFARYRGMNSSKTYLTVVPGDEACTGCWDYDRPPLLP